MNLPEINPTYYYSIGLLLTLFACIWFINWLFKRPWLPEWFDSDLRKRLKTPLLIGIMLGAVSTLFEAQVFKIDGWAPPMWLLNAMNVVMVAILFWASSVILRVLAQLLKHKKKADNQWQTNISGLEKFGMVVIATIGSIFILKTLDYDISSILALGGISGIAIGLAARDMLANIFGGLFLYFDKPFSVNDWIRSPDRSIEGTVQKIGLRQTTVRTFNSRPIYIPNALFNNIVIENPTRMLNRRIYEKFGLRYEDSHVLSAILLEIEKSLKNNPEIDSTKTLMVNFDCFGESALECFIYTFTKTTNWQEYHAIKQKVMLDVLVIIAKNGASCAFPTQTLDIKDSTLSGLSTADDENAAALQTLIKKSPAQK